MRLIDADALLKQIDKDSEGNEGWYGDTWQFVKTIEDAPTIEPEVDEVCGFYIEELIDIAKRLKAGDDLISRKDAIEALGECPYNWCDTGAEVQAVRDWELYKSAIEAIPSAQPKLVNDSQGFSQDIIRRDDAIKAICEDGTWLERQGCYEITMAERKQRDADILSGIPSAQPKQVRCKECKHWSGCKSTMHNNHLCRRAKNVDYWTRADDFCSYGERKSDE